MKILFYAVNVNVIHYDSEGVSKNESFSYKFSDGLPIDMRKAAVFRAIEMFGLFDEAQNSGQINFVSGAQAIKVDYKNISGYSVDIEFSHGDEDLFQIYGERDREMLENLETEAGIYSKESDVQLTTINDHGVNYTVLLEDIEFFLGQFGDFIFIPKTN